MDEDTFVKSICCAAGVDWGAGDAHTRTVLAATSIAPNSFKLLQAEPFNLPKYSAARAVATAFEARDKVPAAVVYALFSKAFQRKTTIVLPPSADILRRLLLRAGESDLQKIDSIIAASLYVVDVGELYSQYAHCPYESLKQAFIKDAEKIRAKIWA